MGLILFTMLIMLRMERINAKDDVHPAKIFGKDFAVEGDEVEFVCSTYGFKTGNDILHVYLCKNGIGIKRQIQRDRYDTIFYIPSVKKEDSGNYTCVHSKTEYKSSDVRGKGDTPVFLRVSAGFLPADIALKETSVMEGCDVELTCAISDFWRADSRAVSYIYLYKDRTAVKIKMWDRRIREAIFILSKICVGDSGSYSCAVISLKLISHNMTELQGNNAVYLQVIGKEAKGIIPEVMVGLVSLLLISSMLLGLWCLLHLKKATCKKCTESEVQDDLRYTETEESRGQNGEANQSVWDSAVLDDSEYDEIVECRGQGGEADQSVWHSEVLDDLGEYNEIQDCRGQINFEYSHVKKK